MTDTRAAVGLIDALTTELGALVADATGLPTSIDPIRPPSIPGCFVGPPSVTPDADTGGRVVAIQWETGTLVPATVGAWSAAAAHAEHIVAAVIAHPTLGLVGSRSVLYPQADAGDAPGYRVDVAVLIPAARLALLHPPSYSVGALAVAAVAALTAAGLAATPPPPAVGAVLLAASGSLDARGAADAPGTSSGRAGFAAVAGLAAYGATDTAPTVAGLAELAATAGLAVTAVTAPPASSTGLAALTATAGLSVRGAAQAPGTSLGAASLTAVAGLAATGATNTAPARAGLAALTAAAGLAATGATSAPSVPATVVPITPVAVSTANGNEYASNAFTTQAGDLIVVGVIASDTVATDARIAAPALDPLTFAPVVGYASGRGVWWFVASGPAPALSGAVVFFRCDSDPATGAVVAVFLIRGATVYGLAAVRCFGSGDGVSGAVPFSHVWQMADPGTFAPGSIVLAASALATGAGQTPPAGFTESADVTYATPNTGAEFAYVAPVPAGHSTRVDWGAVAGATWITASFELAPGGAAGARPTPLPPTTVVPDLEP